MIFLVVAVAKLMIFFLLCFNHPATVFQVLYYADPVSHVPQNRYKKVKEEIMNINNRFIHFLILRDALTAWDIFVCWNTLNRIH